MKNKTTFTTFCIILLFFTSYSQITIATNATNPEDSYDYIFNWDGTNIDLFGYNPYFVRAGENPRIEESGSTFTNGRINDSFGYRISAVLDWDSDTAVTALNNGTFIEYLNSLTAAEVDKHVDLDNDFLLGTGVENGLSELNDGTYNYYNRRDRVGIIGEALILTFDTTGRLEADNSIRNREFVPTTNNFTNTGLNTNTALRISDLHLEPSGQARNNTYRRLDYFIYDASENSILTDDLSDSGMELSFPTLDTNGTINKAWTLDDGDMIILAYRNPPEEMEVTRSNMIQYSWGLWSMKMDLIDKSILSNKSTINKSFAVLENNPTSNKINLILDKVYKNISIKLYGIEGREILSHNYSSKNKLSIDIESLKNGNYFLILNLDGNTNTHKIVKN